MSLQYCFKNILHTRSTCYSDPYIRKLSYNSVLYGISVYNITRYRRNRQDLFVVLLYANWQGFLHQICHQLKIINSFRISPHCEAVNYRSSPSFKVAKPCKIIAILAISIIITLVVDVNYYGWWWNIGENYSPIYCNVQQTIH